MTDAWKKRIALADMYGTRISVSYEPPEDELEPYASITVETGSCHLNASATPEAMRQLAAALLDAAEHTEQAAA